MSYELGRNYERMREKLIRHFYCIDKGEHMPQYFETREEFEQFIKFLKYVNENKTKRNFANRTLRLRVEGTGGILKHIYVSEPYKHITNQINAEQDSWNEIQFDKFILTDYNIPTPCVAVLNYPLRSDGIKLQIYSSVDEYKKAFKDNKPHGHIFTWQELLETVKLDMSVAVELEVYDCETKEYYDDIDFEITTSGVTETAHIPKGDFSTEKRLLKGANWSVKIKNNPENCKSCSPSNGFIYGDSYKDSETITFKIDENTPKKYKLVIKEKLNVDTNSPHSSVKFLNHLRENSYSVDRQISSHSSVKLLNYLRKKLYSGDRQILGFSFYDLENDKEMYSQSDEITLKNIEEKFDYNKILEIVDPHKKYILEVKSNMNDNVVYSTEADDTKEMLVELMKYLNVAPLELKSQYYPSPVLGNFEISIKDYREQNILYKFFCRVSGIEDYTEKDIGFYVGNNSFISMESIDEELMGVLKK